MASSLSLDISGLTSQVVSAVTTGVGNIQKEITKIAETAGLRAKEKKKELDISGMREQILDNARVAFRLQYGVHEEMPDMKVVVVGCNTTITAEVIRRRRGESQKQDHYLAPRTRDHSSRHCTLPFRRRSLGQKGARSLLTLTSKLLQKLWRDLCRSLGVTARWWVIRRMAGTLSLLDEAPMSPPPQPGRTWYRDVRAELNQDRAERSGRYW